MKTILTRMFTVVVLMMICMAVDAQVKVEIEKFEGGTIKEKGQTKPDDKGLVTVTITVTPDKGYTISSKDITVVSTIPPTGSGSGTRTPQIAAPLTLLGTDPKDLSEERDYRFIVGSTLGAWVKEAKFRNPREGTKGTPTPITSLSGITDPAGEYKITADINASGFTTIASFSGTLEAAIDPTTHMPYRITNLNAPLFTTLTGTVKNLVIESVSISQDGKVGAIACTATGSARIYNVGILGGSIESTGTSSDANANDCCGGLVGLLDGNSNASCTPRVVNCYSYADITGGNRVGGIVGYNNYGTNKNNLRSMVFCCMFYGDITGGNNKAPIYNGTNISNKDDSGVGNYNYFRAEASYVQNQDIKTYNCALMAETRYLQRFEFFRHILNGHRELAGWWATGTYSKSEMLKWVMEPSQIGTDIQYPILKEFGRYPSVVNIDVDHSETGKAETVGPIMSTLDVTIRMGSGDQFGPANDASIHTTSLRLNITGKDPDHFNFNYYKVQLPFYNDVGTNNYKKGSDDKYRVVTGWKIVAIDGTTTGSMVTGGDVTFHENGTIDMPYNFADRNVKTKDIYHKTNNPRVFNQGAYWDVPEGVTSITIEPYWAKAVFLADKYADVVYNQGMDAQKNIDNVGGGAIYNTDGGSYLIDGEDKTVYTSMSTALSNLGPNTSHRVNDYAIVLVGNYHYHNGVSAGDSKPYTIMSADFDHDNEPDYSYFLRFNGRTQIHPVKIDFLNIIGLGMAQKSTGGTGTYNLGIPRPIGWFEVTNTGLFRVTQMEYERSNRAAQPIILQGGVMEQWVSAQNDGNGNKTTYFHVGGNVWFKEFHLGCHIDKSDITTKHPPISVTGGDFDAFYLTGLYANVGNYNDNAECYINGGNFGIVAGTGMEGIGNASTHANGNIFWQIDNADIKEFYGGGINAAKPAEGNIYTIISNSRVETFCGGPQFGDMNSGRTVKTIATGCTFGTFYGAGYGGNSYYSAAPANFTNKDKDPWNSDDKGFNLDWDKWVKGEIKGVDRSGNYANGVVYTGYHRDYIAAFGGVSSGFTYEFLPMSNNQSNVARLFLKFVKFSLATTRDVTSTLTNCIIKNNFYGGGCLGKVEGPVTSTLTDCEVRGNVFGAGYSAKLPTVEMMKTGGFKKQPKYDKNLGVYLPGEYKDSDTYTWEHAETVNSTATAIKAQETETASDRVLYTTEDLTTSNLGSVAGDVILNLQGDTSVTGNVFGGGESSYVTGADHTVTVTLEGNTEVSGNVFGGGDNGVVEGSTVVNIKDEDE